MRAPTKSLTQRSDDWRAASDLLREASQKASEIRAKIGETKRAVKPIEHVKRRLLVLLEKRSGLIARAYEEGSAKPNLRALDEQIAQEENRLDDLRRDHDGIEIAVRNLAKKLEHAEAAEATAQRTFDAAKIAWALARIDSERLETQKLFDSVAAKIERLKAIEQFLPPPKDYPMLGVTEQRLAEQLFFSLQRLVKSHPKPDFPFDLKWLNVAFPAKMPGVEVEKEKLDEEVKRILDRHDAP